MPSPAQVRPHTPAAAKAASAGDPVRSGVPENPKTLTETGIFSDRDFQDEVIRYLTDAKLRSSDTNTKLLEDTETGRAKRFSHFLARRYYRDRMHRAFRYSATLISPPQAPELVAESPEFDSILETCTLGSLDTSREVGQLAIARLLPLGQEEWWADLIDYELAFFIQLATSEAPLPSTIPIRNPSTILHKFQFRIPELLECLRTGRSLADDFRAEVALLFSRTHHGKIYIVEADESAIMVFLATDGRKSSEEIATSCGIWVEETRRILSTLSDIGSIVLAAA
jgi:hypothetical protein